MVAANVFESFCWLSRAKQSREIMEERLVGIFGFDDQPAHGEIQWLGLRRKWVEKE